MVMEGTREDIKKILEAAVHAPSGENCQPWRFEINDREIRIFNLRSIIIGQWTLTKTV